ncbi:Ketosteroid isomerase homolog [Sphingomonas laterariae]|uniref:Ketosteroid isomerase homolog n=1 Tax=Edaphosphingomonas laterariae TaxID=861865 RepID=A0A239BBK0_9SPHN|nr:nuclear transport factor 2 family protein [Sphingomonas laterariae]SNS04818.1 Ketosteroid isomerase homolog [Sphingomonas laterariae]
MTDDLALLRETADQIALSRLVDAYARAVDRCDLALLRSLYADDAVHDHGTMFRGSADAFADYIGKMMRGMVSHHFMGNRLFAIDGDVATGETYAINSHVLDPGTPEARDYIAGGRYLDRFRRTSAGWRIAHRTRVIDWTHERPHQSGATAAGLAAGGKCPDDPSYAFLSAGFRA